jgi:hypothetical protein
MDTVTEQVEYVQEISKELFLKACCQRDLVVGAFDKFSSHAVLQFICLLRRRPFLAALGSGLGKVSLFFSNKPGCYCCSFSDVGTREWYDGGHVRWPRWKASGSYRLWLRNLPWADLNVKLSKPTVGGLIPVVRSVVLPA